MIIGMLGQKQVGKDTAADYIIHHIDATYCKYSLAYPMKEAVKIIFGWTEEHVNGKLKEVIDPVLGISPRQALTTIGTDWGQYMLCSMFPQFAKVTGRKLWVNCLLRQIKEDNWKNVIISDVRFEHEVEAIHSVGGKILKIVRPSLVNTDTHESEQGGKIEDYDYLIVNEGTLADYFLKVKCAYDFLVKGDKNV